LKRAEIVRLAHEISRDLEDTSISTSVIVAKARRLANFVEHKLWEAFFSGEAVGYSTIDDDLNKFLQTTGRWDGKTEKFTNVPVGLLEANIKLWENQIEAQKAFQPSGDWAASHHQTRMQQIVTLSGLIAGNERIIATVRGLTHQFCTLVMGTYQFSQESKTIFESFSISIDKRLGELAEDAFGKLPHAFERLDSGTPEAISHAMTSCRRIIDSFADSVFPARSEPMTVGQEKMSVTAEKPKNRILAYVYDKVSRSRYDRIRRSLFDLYERVSAGVHSDVVPTEAKALVLQTYLLLGEIAELL
jgi:hypothetical protein